MLDCYMSGESAPELDTLLGSCETLVNRTRIRFGANGCVVELCVSRGAKDQTVGQN